MHWYTYVPCDTLMTLILVHLLCWYYLMNPTSSSSVCFVAGRSGGHIVPCLTMAHQIKQEHPDIKIIFFSTHTPLDITILQNSSDIKNHIPLPIDPVPSYRKPLHLMRWLYSMVQAWITSFKILKAHKPYKIITTGGYCAIPVCLAGWMLNIPVELHQLDVIPGKAIKAIAPIATTIYIYFKQTQAAFANPTNIANYPVRFNAASKTITPTNARRAVGLEPALPTVLVLGGSQGSQFLNTLVALWVQQHITQGDTVQVIHQTGAQEVNIYKSFYSDLGVRAWVFDYHHALEYAYQAADIVICRSGAGSLFETIFFNKPCITIPLISKSTAHQVDNAYALAQTYPHLIHVLDQAVVEKQSEIFKNRIELLLKSINITI